MSNQKIAKLPHPPKAVLCDLDGTLADSMAYLYNVYAAFMQHCNLEPTREEFISLVGPPISEVVDLLREKYALTEDPKVLYKHYVAFFKEFSEKVPLMPGALDFLQKGRHLGAHFYLVTSASRAYAERFVQTHELEPYFDGIVAYEDAPMSKPHPAPYLKALTDLNVKSVEAIAVEDSSSGVASATGAGVKTFWLIPHLSPEAALIEWRGDICQVPSWKMILELVYGTDKV